MRRALLTVLVVVTLAGCGDDKPRTVAADLPERVLPTTVGDYTAKREPAAQKAFASAGDNSLTAHGAVWTLRKQGAVRGALQVGVLKPEYDTEDIDVRRGVRSYIETGQYRWFKVAGQWVGVQELPELRLYLWFPPRGDLYEVLQLQPSVPDQKELLESIVTYQKGAS